MLTRCGIVEGPLTTAQLLPRDLHGPGHGALVSFIGVVRDEHLGRTVTRLVYDCYRDMARRLLEELAAEARSAHGAELAIALYHGTGPMAMGDASVAIHVASGHRPAAYAANRLLIERIKEDLPVWKQEFYADGSSAWLEGS